MGELHSDDVLNRGALRVRTHDPRDPNGFRRSKAHDQGFDLDAHVAVPAGARAELERMVRYILRPPLKETRLTLQADSVLLELKTPWRDGTSANPQRPRNTAWAELMRHSFGLDVLACPHCGGRMRHVTTILSTASVRAILQHQGHPLSAAPKSAPGYLLQPILWHAYKRAERVRAR